MEYEYCVMMKHHPQEPHRVPPALDYDTELPVDSLEWCREWVREWEEDVSPQAQPGIFYVARRPVGAWEKMEES